MESSKLTAKLLTNTYYHTIASYDLYGEPMPVSCSIYISSVPDIENFSIGLNPMFMFPTVELQPVKQTVHCSLERFDIDDEMNNLQPVIPRLLSLYSLIHLYSLQSNKIINILKKVDNKEIDLFNEKYLYRIIYFDFDHEIKNKDDKEIIEIYTTFDKKLARNVLKQFRRVYGRNKVSLIKFKTTKLLNNIDKESEK